MSLLSREDITRIHEKSLDVLARVGVRVDDGAALKLLLDHGASPVGREGVVRLDPELVQRCLSFCPRRVTLASLSGDLVDLRAGGPSVFWTGNALTFVQGKAAEPIRSAPFARYARLCDQLDSIQAIVGPCLSDVPPRVRGMAGMRVVAENSLKHIRPCIYDPREIGGMIEMAAVILDGAALREKPVFSLGYTAVSPLRWSELALAAFRESSGHGLPLMINSEPAGGVTAPVTLAGELVVANAEALSGVVIVQLLEPGRPVIFNLGFAHVMDMQTTVMRTGSVENALLQAAGAEIAAFHGLPSAAWASTESPIADAQAAWEKTLLASMHAASRVNVIWGMGNLEATKALSFEQTVIDDDVAGAVLRAQRGVEVNDDTLAINVIAEMGQKAEYLGHEHTFGHFRSEYYFPRVASRVTRGEWARAGETDLADRARARVEELLKRDVRTVLSAAQKRDLGKIQRRWEKELG